MPQPNPRRIVVIGDTGCRLKRPNAFQACNDPQAWPFAAIARAAARWQPDIVIHVGDYHYREALCPTGNAGCSGSPWADNWAAWQADFFTPAADLLRAAPWVMVRGNHESCQRAGAGWFRFLDPQLPALGCRDYSPPYAARLGELQSLVLDSAILPNETAPAELVAFYAAQFEAIRQLAGSKAWLLVHHPIWGVGQSNTPPTARANFNKIQPYRQPRGTTWGQPSVWSSRGICICSRPWASPQAARRSSSSASRGLPWILPSPRQ